MLRKTIVVLAATVAALAGNAVPADAAEAQAALVNIWYRVASWPCPTTCTGGYQTDDWIKVSSTGITGGPSFDWESFNDPSSSMYVSSTNCLLDHVSAHLVAPPGTGSNTGTIDLNLTRVGEPTTVSLLVGTLTFDSDNNVGSGTYTIAVPATGELLDVVDKTNACLAGPHTEAQWSGTGVAVRAVI